jgi:hypothetical protein
MIPDADTILDRPGDQDFDVSVSFSSLRTASLESDSAPKL